MRNRTCSGTCCIGLDEEMSECTVLRKYGKHCLMLECKLGVGFAAGHTVLDWIRRQGSALFCVSISVGK